MTDGIGSPHRATGQSTVPTYNAELLNVQAVATLLGGCSTRHVYRLADSGRMPKPLKLGALVRWRRGELNRWLEQGCPPVANDEGAAK